MLYLRKGLFHGLIGHSNGGKGAIQFSFFSEILDMGSFVGFLIFLDPPGLEFFKLYSIFDGIASLWWFLLRSR